MNEDKIESPELREYRVKARAWLADHIPPLGRGDDGQVVAVGEEDDPAPERQAEARQLQAKLYEAGYAGFTFPVDYGGQGLTLDHEGVFLEEAAGYDLPIAEFGVSINILGATLAAFGTHEQKLAHIPNILSGKERWLQFLSEPSGGSDLAGLLTSATRDGDSFVVNGQKTWSTGAHLSNFALCPVRTRWDVPKHKGISVLIIDLKTPGIEIRRIKQINGGSEFCEEFFTDALVPASNLVGGRTKAGGWPVVCWRSSTPGWDGVERAGAARARACTRWFPWPSGGRSTGTRVCGARSSESMSPRKCRGLWRRVSPTGWRPASCPPATGAS